MISAMQVHCRLLVISPPVLEHYSKGPSYFFFHPVASTSAQARKLPWERLLADPCRQSPAVPHVGVAPWWGDDSVKSSFDSVLSRYAPRSIKSRGHCRELGIRGDQGTTHTSRLRWRATRLRCASIDCITARPAQHHHAPFGDFYATISHSASSRDR